MGTTESIKREKLKKINGRIAKEESERYRLQNRLLKKLGYTAPRKEKSIKSPLRYFTG
jgi:hypothetical protein